MSSDIATRKPQRDVEPDEDATHVSCGESAKKVMVDVTTCCEPVNHFRFLDLLPELRNHVYSFAFESTVVHIRPYTVIDSAPGIGKRNFYGLTQVCRQIREEFRPIYMKENEVHIHPDHATLYIESFFPLLSSDNPEAKKLLGNFVLDLDVPNPSYLSLIPLLQLILDVPGIKWKFTGPVISAASLLSRLFCGPGSIATWQSHIQEPIVKIGLEIAPHSRHLVLRIILQFRSNHPWITELSSPSFEVEDCPHLVSFLKQLGMSGVFRIRNYLWISDSKMICGETDGVYWGIER